MLMKEVKPNINVAFNFLQAKDPLFITCVDMCYKWCVVG